ncbi:MAG: hypothetical protein ACI9G1_005316, partial [Pirellulaceae bacterium]
MPREELICNVRVCIEFALRNDGLPALPYRVVSHSRAIALSRCCAVTI